MIMTNEEEKGRVPVCSGESGKLLDEKEVVRALNPRSSHSIPEMGQSDNEVSAPLRASNNLEGHLTRTLACAVFAVTLSSFQFGYHIGCVNAPGGLITEWIIESHQQMFNSTITRVKAELAWSVAVSVFAVGGMVGGLLSGWLADSAGRRGALLYNNLVAFAAAALMALAKSVGVYPMIIIGRLFIGFNCGLSSGLVPMYLTEVSPINLRGMLGSLHQLLVTVAILVSQIFGLPHMLGTYDYWPLIFAFTVVPAFIQLATLPLCPESPKFTLAVRGQSDRAETDLKRLRGINDVSAELDIMREELASSGTEERPSMASMFRGSLRWPMTIAIMMMLSQQLSGINVAMYYSTVIFEQAGLTGNQPFYATIGMGTVNVIMTIISVWLVDHPKFGRRSLHLIGLCGMWVSTLLIVGALTLINQGSDYKWASYGAIGFVILFVIAFATGPGAIPWFFVSEIFTSNARGSANSIAVMVNWMANLVVALTFLPIKNVLGQYSFFVFTFFLTVFILFTWRFVPETKGKTVEEINLGFEKNRR